MKSRSLHNSTKKGFMISFTVTLGPFMKYHSPSYFPSRNITKITDTHPPSMRDVIIEQPPISRIKQNHTKPITTISESTSKIKVKLH